MANKTYSGKVGFSVNGEISLSPCEMGRSKGKKKVIPRLDRLTPALCDGYPELGKPSGLPDQVGQ